MQFVRDRNEEGTNVVLDDTTFVNCSFTNCRLLYSGGDYGWNDTQFNNCKVLLKGPAQRTAALLSQFGWKEPKPDATQSPTQTVH